MAEALFRRMLKENNMHNVEVDSAGVAVFLPSGASENAIEVMRRKGIDLSEHRAKQVTQEDIQQADLILTMTVGHRERLTRLYPYAADKIFTLKEYISNETDLHDLDILDPFGGDIHHYEQCADEIYHCLESLIPKIKDEWGL